MRSSCRQRAPAGRRRPGPGEPGIGRPTHGGRRTRHPGTHGSRRPGRGPAGRPRAAAPRRRSASRPAPGAASPGLRREEVAQLAGHLGRLPGPPRAGPRAAPLRPGARGAGPGAADVRRRARPAVPPGRRRPRPRPGTIDGVVRAGTTRLMDRLTDLPVMLLDAKGDVLAWNALAAALLGDFSAWPPPTAQHRVAALPRRRRPGRRRSRRGRAHAPPSGGRPAGRGRPLPRRPRPAPAARRPAGRQRRRSAGCGTRGGWPSAAPTARRSTTPSWGRVTFDCDLLLLPQADQRLIVYSAAPGTREAEALAMLRVVGLQHLSPGTATASRG